jgi:hypothetical protein
MPDGILLENGNNLVHEGSGQILLEGEGITLVIPATTSLGLAIGSEAVDTGFAIGSEVITGASN